MSSESEEFELGLTKTIEGATTPPIPSDRYDLRVLRAIRRIIRSADLHSRKLASQHGVTVPQLLCLTQVVGNNGVTVKEIAEEIYVSPSTVVGILDRLERQGWVKRKRSLTDKRVVHVFATEEGTSLVSNSPSPLHEELVVGIREIPESEQAEIAESMEKLVSILEIQRVDASPILETGVELDDGE